MSSGEIKLYKDARADEDDSPSSIGNYTIGIQYPLYPAQAKLSAREPSAKLSLEFTMQPAKK